ncbi:3-keto-disaccharide hydrolase [Frigoriglobus tundricola]|uniref:3-keto-alpha-glucoside-1,2-lyase/3-keto-2-hydroxy-glucal hydratase domain-containing protein n=1 Tax=Frigoriglobus tundricola TaxID=2774151 RepID=A0A6M5YRN0_9BACT|nr:DUF1080 domain-containing protein [Frigoriglobus tundricola]QJW96084.1 hypothetical protein FTUN_3638 [Frigoriglobus tundricola]
MRHLSCALFVCAMVATVTAADEPTPEPGFKLVFNGTNLDGWQTRAAKPASLEGKTGAFEGRFAVKDGALVIDYKVKDDKYIETVQPLTGDFTIRYGFKPGEGCNNDTLLLGTKFDILAGGKLKGVKDGEWNTMEIVVKGGSADFIVNRQKLATQKTKAEKGPLVLRAEFGHIAYRNIRVSETK